LTTPSQHARQALGARLREIRTNAHLTGRALADVCGWHFSKISKIENGVQAPSEDDIQAWCRACEAEREVPDLVATAQAIESMYVEWRRALRSGMKHSQRARLPLYERTTLFRVYEPGIMPGLFQTPEYASTIIAKGIDVYQLPNDHDEALAARLERQRVLHAGDRRFLVVLEEQALRTRVGNAAIMLGQLGHLLYLMSLPRVSVGIIPSMGERTVWTSAGFWIFDQHTVRVETPSAELTITQRSEITVYERRFGLLQESAVYGQAARDVVTGCFPPDATTGAG
jgi:transcriptional regulator with XRE-family HTH domain